MLICILFLKLAISCSAGDIVLFIDEAHIVVEYSAAGNGNKGSGLDIGNLLKPSLGRGQLQVRVCSLFLFYSCSSR